MEPVLTDKPTLMARSQQWVKEPLPISRPLQNLTNAEPSLYEDLVEDRYGLSIRLGQERARASLLRLALEPWIGRSTGSTAYPSSPQETRSSAES